MNGLRRVGLPTYLCAQCGDEIAAYALGNGRLLGLGCIRRALARAGVAIGWAIK